MYTSRSLERTQDGVASPEDIDTAISHGLGLRYSFSGPFETMHLNANGIDDYCQRYGTNIVTVCESQTPPRPLTEPTVSVLREYLERIVPLENLSARRQWREGRLAALAKHKRDMESREVQEASSRSE